MSSRAARPDGKTRQPLALALLCDEAFHVSRVLHESPRLPVAHGDKLLSLFDPGSLQKALRLMQALREEPFSSGWELLVAAGERAVSLRFLGARVPGGLLIAGAEDAAAAQAIFEREMAALGLEPPAQNEATDAAELYEQFSALNNQLVDMQRELGRKNAELARLIEERGKISAMAAHDLRSPLQVVINCAQLLQPVVSATANEQAAAQVAMIQRNAEKMLSMVGDLLVAYRLDIGALELALQPLELEALVRINAENNRAVARRKDIDLVFRVEGSIPRVMGDPVRLDQLLDNLVHNAIKFSSRGSRIRMGLASAGSEVVIRVCDEGIGMRADVLDALLGGAHAAPRRGTQAEPGFGLGLSIVRAIVEKHGGALEGHSNPGDGTTFLVRLPAMPP